MSKRIPKAISDYMRTIGRKGGKKSGQSLTAEDRSERARKAAQARWKRPRRKRTP
jgi:general stress protein YciG